MAELTPMMKQYMETKEQHADCILFYRLGDFYEMFFEDALTASKELEITLTGKNCGLEERAPMCGVPFHSADVYINKLVQKGYKVAICEQVEDPKNTKGLVKREVIRIVTPGTNTDESSLEQSKNNYIACIVYMEDRYGLAVSDVTTGEFLVTQIQESGSLFDEIMRFTPSELLCNDAFLVSGFDVSLIRERLYIQPTALASLYFDGEWSAGKLKSHFHTSDLSALGLENGTCGCLAAGALLAYLFDTQKNTLTQLNTLHVYGTGRYMLLDHATRRNLELCETLREKQKKGSLLWVLDKTKTAMGARLLRKYVEQPLLQKDEIICRQQAVEELVDHAMMREELREYLNGIYDLERLTTRITYKTANARDLRSFSGSLAMLPDIRATLADASSPLLRELYDSFDTLEDLCSLISRAIEEEAPVSLREGGLIKTGFNEEVDRLRRAKTEGKDWLAQLEAKERDETGIKNLKIKYNKVFGYYLEVTNSYKDLVPDHFVRKQTLANAERYSTIQLKELEETILGAQDKLYTLEYDLYCQIRDEIGSHVKRIQDMAKKTAVIDALASLAKVAEKNNYVKPTINETGKIDIKDGRHPVVELMIPSEMFICNDTYLDDDKRRVSVITGPNMAGKSTYMRQVALIVLMAQIGSFVPAREADISLVDRIFTRVGASDDLASGQSTFMVEMTEVANILRNATPDSLLVLDEIGRGTSTFDGLSIAWSVVEHISDEKILGAKTLFATHYHELTELEGKLHNVNNYCIAVKEKGDDIVFLRKIIPGGADRSYGIQVAKLAGVPDDVIARAKEIARELEKEDMSSKLSEISNMGDKQTEKKDARKKEKRRMADDVDLAQYSLFDTVHDADVLESLKNIDVSNLTPMEALNIIYELQNKLKNRWQGVN